MVTIFSKSASWKICENAYSLEGHYIMTFWSDWMAKVVILFVVQRNLPNLKKYVTKESLQKFFLPYCNIRNPARMNLSLANSPTYSLYLTTQYLTSINFLNTSVLMSCMLKFPILSYITEVHSKLFYVDAHNWNALGYLNIRVHS